MNIECEYYICVAEGALIDLADGSSKPVEEIAYEDELLAWDFDSGEMSSAHPAWISIPHEASFCYKVSLSDGTILRLVGSGGKSHRLFNIDKGKFLYPQDFKANDRVYRSDGSTAAIVAIERIDEPVTYYNLQTAYRLNYFVEGVCAGSRLSNIYPIADMKYVKEPRAPASDFEGIPQHYIDELRLLEQPEQDPSCQVIRESTLEEHIEKVYWRTDTRYAGQEGAEKES